MNKSKKVLSIFILMIFLSIISFTSPAFPAPGKDGAPDSKPVAEVMAGSNGITWQPKISYGQLLVTVSRPDGSVFSKTFEAGVNPYLDLASIAGDNNCNGSFTYELRVIPVGSKKVRGEEPLADVAPIQEALTQSGHFLVQGGAIVGQNNTENLARPMDVVHADDVIITGSICVGFDCATDGTESFGLDTIKLKENSLRIFFDDTSTSVGFPANDWRLTANDSGSGGGNYFSIDDVTNSKTPFKVEANAPSNSLYVDDAGRVGIGTATPIYQLHVVRGDSPTLRLDQDGSYGWSPYVWDIAGNESNFFIRDVTGGSKLPIRIQPGTPTNTITLRADGKVGFGTWAPTYPMELDTTGINASIAIKRTDGATCYINATDTNANFGAVTDHPLRLVVNSVWKLRLNSDNSLSMASGASCTAGGAWTDASSRSLKENIQTLGTDEALNTLTNLCPVKYNYIADKEERHVGFIAEDAPELVATKDRKGMSPMDVVAVLTKVLQEQQKAMQEQQKAIQEQQKTITELKEKIAAMEKK